MLDVEHARYMARYIPGAKLVELPGEDHSPWVGDRDALLDEVEQFLTGRRHVQEPERVLATVLFVDIVGSTERAAALGDGRWRELLEAFYAKVREVLQQYRGTEINTSGDGILAAFDGPARAVRCAGAIRNAVRSLNLEVRCGLHNSINSGHAGTFRHFCAGTSLAGGRLPLKNYSRVPLHTRQDRDAKIRTEPDIAR
jgi:class 3 adenylate cyclase